MFDPKEKTPVSSEENHLAQMIEILKPFPKSFALSGTRSKKFFTKDGKLRHVSRLNPWSLKNVLIEKHYILPRVAK